MPWPSVSSSSSTRSSGGPRRGASEVSFLEAVPPDADGEPGSVAGGLLDILIIDDSKYIRAFARIHLQEAGWEVGEVEPASLFDVLEALHAHQPSLVITDYEMPFCNGETLVRAIREDLALKHIPVIVLSAHRESEIVERLSRWDLAAYVFKPIRPEDLVAKVRQFLEAKA